MLGQRWRCKRHGIFGLTAAAVLAGCADPASYTAPIFPFLGSYGSAREGAPTLLSNAGWWKLFDDPTLNILVDRGISGSLTLDLARERATEAQANLNTIPLSAFIAPRAGLRREGSDPGETRTRADAALGFDWILDIWGKRRAQVDVASARIEIADAELDAAQLFMLLNIANAYVDLRYWQRIHGLRQQELASRRQTLGLIERLFASNAATRVDVVKAEALVSETQAAIPEIRAAIAATKHEIAVLLGRIPGTLDIDLDRGVRQPRASLSPDVGIPADLLRNRPDIRIAERSYYAAIREVAAARADLYPQLSLSGNITLTSLSSGSSAEYFFGPALRIPIVAATERRATVSVRESRVRQAHTSWRLGVIEAIRDVESSLVEYASSLTALRSSEKTVRLYGEVVDLTRQLVTRDGATIRDLIDAEQNVANANTTLANNLRRVGRSYIGLNVNLGSGSSHGRLRTVSPSE